MRGKYLAVPTACRTIGLPTPPLLTGEKMGKLINNIFSEGFAVTILILFGIYAGKSCSETEIKEKASLEKSYIQSGKDKKCIKWGY